MVSINGWVLALLSFFYVIFIARSIMLAVLHGINPFSLGKGKKGFRRIVELLFSFGLLYWTWETVNASFEWGFTILPEIFYLKLFDNPHIEFFGVGLLAFGNLIFFWALLSFGASWRIGIDHQTPGELVTSGIFGLSRNPIFVAVDLIMLGVTLVYGNVIFLIALILAVCGIHYQILQEEKFLSARYGEKYLSYRQRVQRYL